MRIEKKGERERCKDRCYRNRNGYRWPGIVPSGCCTLVGDELLDQELRWLGGAGYENELNPMGAGGAWSMREELLSTAYRVVRLA